MLTEPTSGDDDGDGNLVLTKVRLSIAGWVEVRRAHGACGIVSDDAVGPANGCSERAAEMFRRMFQRVDSLCQKSSRATSESGARPRPVSIACRYVRTHAMGAVGAVEQEQQQKQQQYSQACLDFAGDTTSLKPAKPFRQLPRRYNFISRLCAHSCANSSSNHIAYISVYYFYGSSLLQSPRLLDKISVLLCSAPESHVRVVLQAMLLVLCFKVA
jgi:hypothetical protein